MSSEFKSSRPDRNHFLKWLLRQIRFGDYIVALCFLLLASTSFFLDQLFSFSSQTREIGPVHIFANNQLVRQLDLRHPSRQSLQGVLGEMKLEIKNNRIRVVTSPCPNKFCVRQGSISRANEMIVCVPNHVVIVITTNSRADLDAITY